MDCAPQNMSSTFVTLIVCKPQVDAISSTQYSGSNHSSGRFLK